jgi:hypothetical protein
MREPPGLAIRLGSLRKIEERESVRFGAAALYAKAAQQRFAD